MGAGNRTSLRLKKRKKTCSNTVENRYKGRDDQGRSKVAVNLVEGRGPAPRQHGKQYGRYSREKQRNPGGTDLIVGGGGSDC